MYVVLSSIYSYIKSSRKVELLYTQATILQGPLYVPWSI